jgi:hypothetical protein
MSKLKRAPRFQPGPTTPVAFLTQEYDRLKAEYAPSGARSIPDLVRAKIFPDSLIFISRRLDELEHSVRQLESRNPNIHGR